MSALPPAAVILAAIILAVSRPYADASRPPGWLALAAGALLGATLRQAVDPAALIAAMHPAAVLAAGWMALCAANGWRPAQGGGAWPAAPAIAAAALTLILAGPAAWPIALLAACAALALDPAAARVLLQRTSHPSSTARGAPALAARAGAMALGASIVPLSIAMSHDDVSPAARMALSLVIGLAAGGIVAGLMRLAQGRAAVLALLVPLPLLVWGAAGLMGAPAMPAIFIAGLIVARDAARRDLLDTVLAEMEMPMGVAAMMLLGAMLSVVTPWPDGSLAPAGALALSVALAGLLASRLSPFLPLSPLAAALALEAFSWSAPVACGLALGMAAGEILWLGWRRLPGVRHA